RSGSGPSRPRSGAPSGEGKPRAPRPPREAGVTSAPAAAPVAAPVARAAASAPSGDADSNRPPRKRRRRRHGVPVDGAVATAVAPQQAQSAQAPKAAAPADNSSFLTKLGRKLKSLVSGS
ncbi:MAG: ATP-dependent RNA helicase RhlB, partial [Pseudoxanthomonas sp.]